MRLAIPSGIAALLLALGWAGPAVAQPFPAAQDTVDVAPGAPNKLYLAITNDTNDGTATGTRLNPNRVYRLARGARYLVQTQITGAYSINIVAAKATAAAPNSTPPIIQRVADADGNISEAIVNSTGNQTYKGIYFLSPAPTGTSSFFMLISSADNITFTMDNCTVEYAQVAIEFRGRGSSAFIRNSRFRNLVDTQQIYAGRAVYFTVQGNGTVPGARNVVFENNTFNTVGGFIFQGPRGGAGVEVEKFRFNHNTIVNVGNYPFLEEQWTDAQVTNNLIVNALHYGETVANRTGQDPEGLLYGIFNVNRLRAGQTTPEAARRIGVIANANYRDPRFDAYYASTPAGNATKVEGEPFFNSRTQDLFNSRVSFVVDRLYQGEAPGFTNGPDNVDKLIQFRRDILMMPVPAAPTNYAYDPDNSFNTVTWPLPENLTYSNTAYQTGGINGYPLGDLNWYPTQKAAWARAGGGETDQAEANQQINMAAFSNSVVSAEAEDLPLTGATNVLSSGDRPPSDANASAGKYVYMEGSGSITWAFTAPAAGSYSLRIRYQVPFDAKAQKVTVNGVAVAPNRPASSQDFFFNEPKEVWQFVDIPVTLTAGSNEVKVDKSFGFMYFDRFEILSLTTAGEAGPADAQTLRIGSTYPNPTTGQAQVRLSLGAAAQVSVTVYDLLGRQVVTASETSLAAGDDQQIAIDASALAPGTYVYRVEARQGGDTQTATGRLTVVR